MLFITFFVIRQRWDGWFLSVFQFAESSDIETFVGPQTEESFILWPSPMGQNFTKARLPIYLLERAFSVLSIIYLLKACPIVGACAVRIQQSSGFPENKLIRRGFLFQANVSVT